MARSGFNPKRRLLPPGTRDTGQLAALAAKASYGGNPEHKQTPGDFGLTPPTDPRPNKTYCDEAGVVEKAKAEALVKKGIEKGLVSKRWPSDWPQNVWSVSDDGQPFEAQLENPTLGVYHGYPMPLDDPFRKTVLAAWEDA